jgi:hypothetical protein
MCQRKQSLKKLTRHPGGAKGERLWGKIGEERQRATGERG